VEVKVIRNIKPVAATGFWERTRRSRGVVNRKEAKNDYKQTLQPMGIARGERGYHGPKHKLGSR
jgi:hypothetical protein